MHVADAVCSQKDVPAPFTVAQMKAQLEELEKTSLPDSYQSPGEPEGGLCQVPGAPGGGLSTFGHPVAQLVVKAEQQLTERYEVTGEEVMGFGKYGSLKTPTPRQD